MIGQTISHSSILEKLCEEGMGAVYKAHDTKLDRNVALRFLPQDLTAFEEERTRFIHEAKAATERIEHSQLSDFYHHSLVSSP